MYNSEKDLPIVLTVEDVRDILRIGTTSAYDLFNSGEFHIVKIGRQMRVSRKVFLDWLINQTEEVAS